jgi:hypothetical protein
VLVAVGRRLRHKLGTADNRPLLLVVVVGSFLPIFYLTITSQPEICAKILRKCHEFKINFRKIFFFRLYVNLW